MAVEAINNKNYPIHILFVEDNPGDHLLIEQAFGKASMATRMTILEDGQKVLDMFDGVEDRKLVDMPDIVLLDLNLPKINGHEVLEWMKSHPLFKEVPVIIFSNSADEQDIKKSHKLKADAYLTKPKDFLQLKQVTDQIEAFWSTWEFMPEEDSE